MSDPLRTTVSQFSAAGGRIQSRAANVRAVEPAADLPGAERGNLYVLVEVTGSGGGHAALYRQILNAIQTAFYDMGDTVEAGLRQAVRAAHAVLRRANEGLPEANWRAGLSCVVYRDGGLLIAQTGPALALLSHPRTIDQFPGYDGPVGAALGGDERPEIEISHTTAEAGSILVLAQSDWLAHVTPEVLAVAAAAESVPLAADYLGQLAADADLTALLVGFGAGPIPAVVEEPRAPALILPPPEPEPTGVKKPTALVAEKATTAPRPGGLRSLFGRSATAEVAGKPAPPAERREEEAGSRSAWPLVLALIGIPLIIAAVVVAMLWYQTRANETRFQEMLAGAATAIKEADGLPDEAAARLRLEAARDFLDKAAVQRPDDPELRKLQAQRIEILNRVNHVVPLYGMVPLWEFRDSGRRLERVVVAGDSLFVLDRGRNEVVRFILSQLRDSVTPADQTAIIQRGQQVGAPSTGSGQAPSTGSGQAPSTSRSGEPAEPSGQAPATGRSGESAGPSEQTLIVSDLVDMTWVEAVPNQRSRLVVLDTAGGLVGYDVTYATTRVPLAGREQPGLPQLLMSYAGNLYIADTKANQIWRYRPGDKGYENPAEKYFAADLTVDLAGMQAMAIDGNIWLLFADGRLLKFYMGQHKPFEPKGLPDPLVAPIAVVAPLGADQIYVADAGNSRIVEFSKDGQFLRQFRPGGAGDLLRDMRDLFLDEAGGRFYVLTGDKLYKADFPKPTPAPQG